MNPSVDGYIRKNKPWQEALQKLREIILDSELTEEVKWRAPCYTLNDSNVLFIGGAKDYCAISFIKGVLLKDPKGILIQQTENSQSVRIIRFTTLQQIIEMESDLRTFIHDAIEVEKAGLKVKFKKIEEFAIPEELQNKFDELPALKTAFTSLTPGRQRGYLLFISGAKQSKTRVSRIEKYVKHILNGKGMDDE